MTKKERDIQRALGLTRAWCVEIPFWEYLGSYNLRTHVKAMTAQEAVEKMRANIKAGKYETLTEETFNFGKVKVILLSKEFVEQGLFEED